MRGAGSSAPPIDTAPPDTGDGGDRQPRAAIECLDVSKALDGRAVLSSVSCSLPAGRVTAIVGSANAGKTVLMNHFVGLHRPDSGEVRVGGLNLARLDPSRLLQVRRRIGVVFQEAALFSGLTVFDNVAFPLRHLARLPEREVRTVVTALLQEVDLVAVSGLHPERLSGGMRKRAAIARALALEPEILLVDEPSGSWEAVGEALFYSRLWNLRRSRSSTVVLASQDLPAVMEVSHHLLVMDSGSVLIEGSPDAVRACPEPAVQRMLRPGRAHG